jgi:hypothetical protein
MQDGWQSVIKKRRRRVINLDTGLRIDMSVVFSGFSSALSNRNDQQRIDSIHILKKTREKELLANNRC